MKYSISKCLIVVSYLTVCFPLSSPSQDKLQFLLSQTHTLQEKGDYLFAAKLYKFIASKTTDSIIMADALYGFVTCGDRAADAFTVRHYTSETFHETGSESTWTAELDPILKRDIVNFAELGIQLKLINHFETYYVNVDTLTRQFLSKRFSNTSQGELATFDLITNEVTSEGYPSFNNPHPVIERATAFLHHYPNSIYQYDVFHILGRAFQDLWEFSRGSYADLLTEKEQANPDELRHEAIKHLKLAKDNRKKLVKLEWDVTSEDVFNNLKNKEDTNGYFYFGD